MSPSNKKPEDTDKLADLQSKLSALKHQLLTATQSAIDQIHSKYILPEIIAMKDAFIHSDILSHSVSTKKTTGWNNKVKEVKEITFDGQ